MIKPHDYVVSLYDVDKDDAFYVGGKAANLGEMIEAGFPVPPGFVVTAQAYNNFLKKNGLNEKIEHLLGTAAYDRQNSLEQVCINIKKMILRSPIPEDVTKDIFKSYEKMGTDTFVAIRSSAIGEDSKDASFAGQNETYLDVKGEAVVLSKVREAWASLFSPRSVYYRHEKKINHLKTGIAIVVQKMVTPEVSGICFTADPVTNNKSKIIIEAIYGLGEYIVQGKVTPDHYEVDKKSFQVISKNIQNQNVMLKKIGSEDREVKVTPLNRKRQKIKDHEIIAIAELAGRIEKHYYFPQDIEWAKENEKFYIVQTRPITTLENNKFDNFIPSAKHPILLGDPASPGIGTGHVKKLRTPKDIERIKSGDVLVALMTDPNYVPAMKRASAIVTEKGGRTSHAAIVAREFGIPAVVGASGALTALQDNDIITVNGKTGEIFRGGVIKSASQSAHTKFDHIKTATKVMVNLAEPELAHSASEKNADGVGLLRAEFMIAQIGIHPKKMIHDGKSKQFVDKLSEGIGTIAKAFYPRPILYRATDFKTNEYANLAGGKLYEPSEENPMIGYRGAFRYMHDPDVFKLELKAIKKTREKMGFNNINLMIPFVRTVTELAEVKKIILKEDLRRSHTFKLYMMAEVPSNVILIEDFIKTGIDGISIGSNDLTMLILGVDRDNQEISSEFDERNKAVLWALEHVIRSCKKGGVDVSICGQAPSVYPGLVEQLVEWGIDSISVSPDAVQDIRRIVYLSEERLVNKSRK